MKNLMIALAAVVAVLTLTACGGGGYGSGDSPPAVQSGDDTATVSAEELGDSGRVLVDSAGKALYAADEEAGSVVCTGACTSFWIPLTIDGSAPSGNSLPSDLGVVQRGDGTRQVTFDGKRLYTFVEDEPGEVTGDGLSDAFDGQQFTWHVVSVGDAPDSKQEDDTTDGSFGY